MTESTTSDPLINPPGTAPDSPRDWIWAGLIGVIFVATMAVAYRPELDNAAGLAMAIVPWLLLVGMIIAWSGRSRAVRLWGIAIAIAGWSLLIFSDDRWSLLSFALFGLCFIVDSRRFRVGLVLAAVVSVVWALSSLGGPVWTVMIPLFVFVASATIAYAIHRIGALTAKQATLIRELEATQEQLAASERSRGVLEERTRWAGEIHDTLAQGFTSIVLLARAGKRSSGTAEDALESIETTAQQNLDTARRLVESSRPDELDKVSLPDALRRHLLSSLPDQVDGDLKVVGRPTSLPASVETVLLRAAQEGVRNACQHAQPNRVDLILTYRNDEVAVAIADDGNGFDDGHVSDRGTLTGGQGLATLARRVESLSGNMTIEAGVTRGSVLTVLVPVGS